MPYIVRQKRNAFIDITTKLIEELKKDPDNVHGNLNYCFSSIINGILGSKYNYKSAQDMIGMLECCKLELYREQIAPYEDLKKKDNGEVYTKHESLS